MGAVGRMLSFELHRQFSQPNVLLSHCSFPSMAPLPHVGATSNFRMGKLG